MLDYALRFGDLSRTDIHAAINLHRVCTYDFAINLEGYELGKGTLSRSSRTDDAYDGLSGVSIHADLHHGSAQVPRARLFDFNRHDSSHQIAKHDTFRNRGMNIDVLGTVASRDSGILFGATFYEHVDNVAFLSLVEIVSPTFDNLAKPIETLLYDFTRRIVEI